MRNVFTVYLLLLCGDVLISQNNTPFFELNSDSTVTWGAGAFGNYNVGSNAITNDFINSFYTGQYIDQAQKDRVKQKLTGYNQLGGDVNAGIYYLHKLDSLFHKKVFAWFVSVKNRQHLNMSFRRDLFNVAFYGNSSYRGQTADFNGFNLHQVRYEQVQAGLISDRYGIGISVYGGEQFQLLKAKRAQLLTSTFGESIDFNTAYTMIVSDPKHTQTGSLNGLGAGLDFYARMPMELRNGKKGDLFVELTDLGFIRWNRNTQHFSNDTNFHYDGFTIQNVFQLADTSVHFSVGKVINSKPRETAAYASHLPTTLDVKFVPLGTKYQCVLGIRYRFSSDYRAYGYGQFRYHLNRHFSFSTELGYGGYANVQSGFMMKAVFGKEYAVVLGTSNLIGYLFPQNTCGQGMYVSISKVFR